jgi:hypothetical protein
MTRPDRYRAVLLGVVIGVAIGGTIISLFRVILNSATPEVSAPKSNFEVVDSYRGCEVVRWSISDFSTYKYFLHCPK